MFYWISAKEILAMEIQMLRGLAHKSVILLMTLLIFKLKPDLHLPVSFDFTFGRTSTQTFHFTGAYRCERTYLTRQVFCTELCVVEKNLKG